MSQQGLRQASVRAVSSSVLDYNGDWHAMWDAQGIAAGTFNERMLLYINEKLTTSYTELNGAMAALAASVSASNFGSIGTFDASTVSIPVLTLVEDGLEEAIPFYTFSSTAAGPLRIDFHTSATPPAAGSGDLATTTQAIGSGNTVFTWDLSPYPGTGYLHFRCTNSAGTSNILTSQVITVSSVSTGIYMEDGSSFILMEDNSSIILMEG